MIGQVEGGVAEVLGFAGEVAPLGQRLAPPADAEPECSLFHVLFPPPSVCSRYSQDYIRRTAERVDNPNGPTPIVLEYSADGRIAINKQDVSIQELEGRLRTIYNDRRDKTMYIAGAGSLRYKYIIEVIDAAKGAGVDKVGIVTEGMRKAAAGG